MEDPLRFPNEKQPLLSTASVYSFEELVTKIPFGRFHILLLFICGLGWMQDNVWMQVVSDILPTLQVQFGISSRYAGLVASAQFAGMCLGSMFWGNLSDKIGRKPSFIITLFVAGIAGFCASVAPNCPLLMLALFCVGLGAGGNLPVDGSMFAEFLPPSKRGGMMVILSLFWAFGSIYAGVNAWYILPKYSSTHPSENHGWRYLLAISAITSLIMGFIRLGFPESPVFLVSKGRHREAEEVLRKIARWNGTKEVLPPSFTITNLVVPNEETDEGNLNPSLNGSSHFSPEVDDSIRRELSASAKLIHKEEDSLKSNINLLLKRPLGYTTVLIWLIWFVTNFGFTGFNLFLPTMLERHHVDMKDTYRDTLIYAAAGIPGSLLGAVLVETFLGRKWTMAISTCISGVFMLSFSMFNTSSTLKVLLCISFVSFASQIMYAAVYTYTPEVFPTKVRTTGMGIASFFSKASGILAPFVMGWLLEIAVPLPLWTGFGFMMLGTACMVILPIETRGRALQ